MLPLLALLALVFSSVGAVSIRRTPFFPPQGGDATLPSRVAGALPSQLKNRPSLIDYDPVANPAAVVTSPDGHARFTVLTDRVLRMEYSESAGSFEDYATIAIMNRNTTVPVFTTSTAGGVLVIRTSSVELSYRVGERFSGTSLTVASLDPTSAFKGWAFGQHDSGNLLGTIRGLDEQSDTDLNCTLNALTFDNQEYNRECAARVDVCCMLPRCSPALDTQTAPGAWSPATGGSRMTTTKTSCLTRTTGGSRTRTARGRSRTTTTRTSMASFTATTTRARCQTSLSSLAKRSW